MNLSELATVRRSLTQRISWPALFLKAYGLLSLEFACLRQTWYPWPLAHLYQHPASVGILTVQREYRGNPWLFWGRIPEPETLSLRQIQDLIDKYQSAPVKEIFRNELKLSRLPTPLRRLIWSWNLRVAKRGRAKRLGTFFLSTLSGRGVEIQQPPSVQTGCLTYGPMGDDNITRVTLSYDHRVMDGHYVASCLNQLELILSETLKHELLKEASLQTNIPRAA